MKIKATQPPITPEEFKIETKLVFDGNSDLVNSKGYVGEVPGFHILAAGIFGKPKTKVKIVEVKKRHKRNDAGLRRKDAENAKQTNK